MVLGKNLSRIQGSKRHRIPDPDPQHWWFEKAGCQEKIMRRSIEKIMRCTIDFNHIVHLRWLLVIQQ
jgi:hypothetical protein